MLLLLVILGAICVYFIVSCNSSHVLPKVPYHKFNPNYPFFIERLYTIVKLGISNAEERLSIINTMCLQYSDLVKVWFGPLLVVFVNHPDRIQKVLLSPKCVEKWNLFYVLMDRETALTTARTTLNWKQHRKFFNPCFSIPAMETFVDVFVENSINLCKMMSEQESEEKEFDFHSYAKKFCFDILCETLVDMKINDLFDETSYKKCFVGFEVTEEAFAHKTMIPFLYPNTLFKLTKLAREAKKAKQILKDFRLDVTEKRRSIMKANETIDENGAVAHNGRCVMMDHIIRNEDKFTDKEIQDHFENFIGAYEILGNAMAHCMLLLAIHPDIQDKLYESIQKTFSSDDDVANPNILMRMQYLDAVIKESLRLMPTIPIIMREVSTNFEIEPGLILPKGLRLVMDLRALHTRKDIWGSDSDEYKPERWMSEDVRNRHLFSFLPFSSGSRVCVGNRFSYMALSVALVHLVKKFKFRSSMTMRDFRVESYISMRLCTEHWMSLQSR